MKEKSTAINCLLRLDNGKLRIPVPAPLDLKSDFDCDLPIRLQIQRDIERSQADSLRTDQSNGRKMHHTAV